MTLRLAAAAIALLACGAHASAAGCDLDEVVGYQLMTARTIEGYIDDDNRRHNGFAGCEPGRLLVFTDRTGVRCKGTGRASLELPKAWLFVRNRDDMKLCVGDDLYVVGPLH